MQIALPDVSPSAFTGLLKCIYSDKLEIDSSNSAGLPMQG